MISILILTLNEENNLPSCLRTCGWSDDIHVLDSYSTDHTVNIAQAHGAKVWFRKFDSFSQHQNWALENIPFKYPWVFYFDADERITPDLAASMQTVVCQSGDAVAFRVQRRDFFLGRWLRHVQMTPFYDRLFRPEKMRYERLGHCISCPDGPVRAISGYLDHYPFSKGMAEWIAKHNFYSTQEAQQILSSRGQRITFSVRRAIFAKDVHERRRDLKELYYRMPARPLLKFLVMYIGKRGFLDGNAGFVYSALIAWYEYMIVLKLRELEQLQGASIESPALADTARIGKDQTA